MHKLHRMGLMLCATLAATFAQADVYVIVNASNPQLSLTHKEAVDLYMGRTRVFANGDHVLACDLPRDSAVRASFYRALTGMSPAQVNSYWSRLMFTGQTMPPQALPNEAAVVELVKHNPGAMGYVSQEPTDKGLHTVLVLKEER
ncbi:MAG: hypothetical protein KGL90_05830 [Burkholderiales bacterium]|nr:hypothetical protein [Burkholderiales bacterium]